MATGFLVGTAALFGVAEGAAAFFVGVVLPVVSAFVASAFEGADESTFAFGSRNLVTNLLEAWIDV